MHCYLNMFVITAKYCILFAILCRLSGYSDGPSNVGCQKQQPKLTADNVGLNGNSVQWHIILVVDYSRFDVCHRHYTSRYPHLLQRITAHRNQTSLHNHMYIINTRLWWWNFKKTFKNLRYIFKPLIWRAQLQKAAKAQSQLNTTFFPDTK